MKRDIDILVLSDIHLGTVGCHAGELLEYLDSINPKKVILNGDFIDIWNFRKFYWPSTHMDIIRRILRYISEGIEVTYLTGNHDELLRKITPLKAGNFQMKDKLVETDEYGRKTWFFHGDIFDITMKHSRWLAKLGAIGYDFLILLNRSVNRFLELLGKKRISLSKKIKNSVKKAVSFIDDFESTAIDLAHEHNYQTVVCGHIHQPTMRTHYSPEHDHSVLYLNSGDWIENLTALECVDNEWSIFEYRAWKEEQILREVNHTLALDMEEVA